MNVLFGKSMEMVLCYMWGWWWDKKDVFICEESFGDLELI